MSTELRLIFSVHVERALFVQILQEVAENAADQGDSGDPGPRRERRRRRYRRRRGVVFKMESHNHPSFIEPYQGAATGVGGILRDVFTMGARPIAAMNALRFGEPDHPKTRHLVSGVVAGIGGYGNSFGVPTVGGEVNFHPRYNGNILVNAMAVGHGRCGQDLLLASRKASACRWSISAQRPAATASTARPWRRPSSTIRSRRKRPTVQVGDPFTEKLPARSLPGTDGTGAIIAIQDMGAAGLTCSAVEMGAKGDLGIDARPRQGAVPRRRHDALRDDAVGKPGAHAHGAAPRTGKGSRSHLPQVGAGLCDCWQDHRPCRHAAGYGSSTTT
jgi:phosphoribosylformylglycinamidine (FGAM) synthase-like enzyme